MTKAEYIDDLREKLNSISSSIEELSNVDTTDIYVDDDEGVIEIQDELDSLNRLLSGVEEDSEEFEEIQSQIEEKESELEEEKGRAQGEIDEIDEIVTELSSSASTFFDEQFSAWTQLGNKL